MSSSYGTYRNDDLELEIDGKTYTVDVEASCSYLDEMDMDNWDWDRD